MLLRQLRLRDFRNVASLEIAPDPRFNVIAGANGEGKTNLAEAVFVLAALKSFRQLRNEAMVRRGATAAICAASVERLGARRDVEVTITETSRRVTLNGKPIRKLADFFGNLNVVAFGPEDIGVMRGAPSERRVALDRMVFNAWPAFADESARYEAALKNRNALLRQVADGSASFDGALLDIYDRQVSSFGARIVARRAAFLARFVAPFNDAFGEIFGPGHEVALQCVEGGGEPAEVPADEADVEVALFDALRAARARDLGRGFTTVGPHRADLVATLDGRLLRDFGSQGQHRAFVLAMKITEIRQLHAHSGEYPVLVLDDVSSELDARRNQQLFDFLSSIDGQVFITTTDPEYVRLSHPYMLWQVREGVVSLPQAAA